jgi:hypothetical protein
MRDPILRTKVLALGALLVVVGAIHVPTIRLGYFGDDYHHRRFILDQLAGRHSAAWWNMFDTRVATDPSGPDPDTLLGRLPWFASPDFQFALLRPLSTASHFVDYLLWPEQPWAMHVHNVVLLAAIVIFASSLYQHLFGSRWQALLATALLAIDDANTSTAGWIASRNTLLTVLLTLIALAFYDRGVTGKGRHAQLAAAVALLLAHASSEGAIVAWAYLIAHAACIDQRAIGARVRSLAPLAAVSIGWLALSAALGYGVRGSDVYVDPRLDPLAFAEAALERWPHLLETQLVAPPVYFATFGPSAPLLAVLARAYLVLWLAVALWAASRSRAVAFFALATGLSLVPQCALDSPGRLLMLSTFAAHGLTAGALGVVARALQGRARALVLAPLGCAIAFIHGWVALELPQRGLLYASALHQSVVRAAESLPSGAARRSATIMVLNYSDYLTSAFVSLYRRELFAPGPERMHVLSMTRAPLRLTRGQGEALQLEATAGSLLEPSSSYVRRAADRMAPGDRFELGEARVEVTSVGDDGAPTALAIRPSASSQRALLWVSWDEARQRFESIVLPEPGQSILIGSAR